MLKDQTHDVIPPLKKSLEDKSGNIRILAAEALYNTDFKELSTEILRKELNNQNELLRVYALNSIDCLGVSPYVFKEDVEALLKDKDPTDNTYYLRAARELIKKWDL